MQVAEAQPAGKVQVGVYIDRDVLTRLQAAAAIRGTKFSTTAAWLLERALTDFEGLSREQKASA